MMLTANRSAVGMPCFSLSRLSPDYRVTEADHAGRREQPGDRVRRNQYVGRLRLAGGWCRHTSGRGDADLVRDLVADVRWSSRADRGHAARAGRPETLDRPEALL